MNSTSLGVAASIAVGSTLQTLIAAFALQRWVGVVALFESGSGNARLHRHRGRKLPHRRELGRRDASARGRRRHVELSRLLADLVARRPDRHARLRAGFPDLAPVAAGRAQAMARGRDVPVVCPACGHDHDRLCRPHARPGPGKSAHVPAAAHPRLDRLPIQAERRGTRSLPRIRDRDRRDRERRGALRRREVERITARCSRPSSASPPSWR